MMEKYLQCIEKFPLASGYILGVYDAVPKMLATVYSTKTGRQDLVQLENAIKKYHPDWTRETMFLHGLDLKEAVQDQIIKFGKLNEDQKRKAMKRVMMRTKHNIAIIQLVHKIGKGIANESRI